MLVNCIWLVIAFNFYRIYFFFVGVKEKVAKRKTLYPPIVASRDAVGGGARPCAPGLAFIQRDFYRQLLKQHQSHGDYRQNCCLCEVENSPDIFLADD